MLKILIVIGLIALSTSSLMKQGASKPASGCIWAFSECNYKGTKVEICGNQANFYNINFNDKMSSIQLGDFTTASIFIDVGYGGQKYVFQRSVKCLSCKTKYASLDKQASAAQVSKRTDPADGCIIAYVDCNYGGLGVEFCNDSSNLANQNLSNTISAVKVSPLAKVTFYPQTNYQGTGVDITSNTSCFLTNPNLKAFNDKAQSLKIFKEQLEQ